MNMIRLMAICGAILTFLANPCFADITVQDRGTWPDSWPTELEPLRDRSRTLQGPKQPLLHYRIPFTTREEFEAAWPHILKVKSQGAPIMLRRGPDVFRDDEHKAGVGIHTPPKGQSPIANGRDANGRWEKTIYLDLIVDGEIVDLNRIPLPADTPIIDERFKE